MLLMCCRHLHADKNCIFSPENGMSINAHLWVQHAGVWSGCAVLAQEVHQAVEVLDVMLHASQCTFSAKTLAATLWSTLKEPSAADHSNVVLRTR